MKIIIGSYLCNTDTFTSRLHRMVSALYQIFSKRNHVLVSLVELYFSHQI